MPRREKSIEENLGLFWTFKVSWNVALIHDC